jgi:AraC family transcriptional regulator
VQLPPTSVPYKRELLRGREVSLFYQCQPPAIIGEHQHRQLQIMLLFEPASCVLSWRTASGEVRERRLVGPHVHLVAPKQVHACRWETEGELLVLYAEESFWRRRLKQKITGVLIADYLSAANQDMVLWQLASTLRQLCNEDGDLDPRLVETVGGALALRSIKLLCGAPVLLNGSGGVLSPNRLRSVDDFIHKELSYDIHVADLAKKAGHSVPHFTAVFKNTTGLAPYEYITRCRMTKAHELLLTGEYRLGEVARAVGFSDQGHFSWRFRKFFRYPPKFVMMRARLKSLKGPKKS